MAQQSFLPSAPFDYAALMQSLFELSALSPTAELLYLGNSTLGRSIPVIRLGHGNKKVLYVGAHHGMEWLTSALLVRFVYDFALAADQGTRMGRVVPEILTETHTLYILPMLNPDGVEYQIHGVGEENPLYNRLLEMNRGDSNFSHWQANARGVDLNHNYDCEFEAQKRWEQENGILGGAPTRYSGEAPESECEVALLCNLIRFHHRELCGIMTLHTQGEEICCGGMHDPHSRMGIIASRLSGLLGYSVCLPEPPASYGGLTDWCVQKMGIPAFTIECGKGKNPLPLSDFPMIYSRIREALFEFVRMI